MSLTLAQIATLARWSDRWLDSDAAARAAVRAEAAREGDAVLRAFDAMVAALDVDPRAAAAGALPPPITPTMRAEALVGAASRTNDVGAALTNAMWLAPGVVASRVAGQHIGPYRLIRELGRGGMGAVWLAERADGQHTRQVALKMPLVENLNWLLAARFARERSILASLEHPGIARLYDAGVDEVDRLAQPYIAIEYVHGQPITAYVNERKLKPELIVQLFIRVIEAVAHAHAQLVIHRDIKPSNVLVDAKGDPHLLDFGIAKLLDDEGADADATQLTRLSGRALTLDYASPEQVNGAALGTASDVYSLGVLLYELLTGNRPYRPKGAGRRELERAILEQEPTKPSDQLLTTGDSEAGRSARRLRGDLDTIVLKALRKEPGHRYATAQAFADDLKRYIAFEPIAAKPDDVWYRVARFVRRNRVGVGVAATLLVATAVGTASTAWQAARAEREAERANAEARNKESEATRANVAAADAQLKREIATREAFRAEQALIAATRERAAAAAAAREAIAARTEAVRFASVAAQQRDEARRQSAIAREEASRADTTTDFLVGAFAEAKPGTVQMAPVTVVKVTEEAIAKALSDSRMAPAVRVPLLTQLGTVLLAQGRVVQAQRLLSENFADAQSRLGSDARVTIHAGVALANADIVAGNFASARDLLNRLLDQTRSAAPALRTQVLGPSGLLASRLRQRDRGIAETAEAYQLCATHCRVEDAIERGSEYANVLTTFGLYRRAMSVYREVDQRIQERYGETHVRRATLFAAMSRTARLMHEYSPAADYARRAIAIDDAVLPAIDYRRALHMYFLALALAELGDVVQATSVLTESVRIARLTRDPQHPDLAHQLNMLGMLLLQRRDHAAAVTSLAEAVVISTRALGPDHRLTLLKRANYGYSLTLSGRHSDGVAEIDAAIVALSSGDAGGSDELVPALERRAWVAVDHRDGAAALAAYERIASVLRELGGERPYWRGRVELGIGWSNFLLRRLDQAEQWIAAAQLALSSATLQQTEATLQATVLAGLIAMTKGDAQLAQQQLQLAKMQRDRVMWPSERTDALLETLSAGR
ncbi:MAG: serine/threonine protein kinase [Burkholderiales bacterium]|nr:serine/threonine protein kinase [Burkholderiales bacterium]